MKNDVTKIIVLFVWLCVICFLLDDKNEYLGCLNTIGILATAVIALYSVIKAKEHFLLKIKPYVNVKDIHFVSSEHINGKANKFQVNFMIQNLGDDVAFDVSMKCYFINEMDNTQIENTMFDKFINAVDKNSQILQSHTFDVDIAQMLLDKMNEKKHIEFVMEIYFKNLYGQWFKLITRTKIIMFYYQKPNGDYCYTNIKSITCQKIQKWGFCNTICNKINDSCKPIDKIEVKN